MAWTYPYGDTSGNPLVVRGVIYGRGRNGSIVAVDAKSGKELWVRENMNGMTNRGLMYWESRDGRDQRLIFAMTDLLQQLDAKTGKSIMSFGTNGVVDLRVGIDGRDPATMTNIASRTPGEVFENLLILGAFTGEDYMSPPGDIRAYDVLTGKLVWTFHTVPRPGEFGYDTWPKDAWKYVGGTNNWGELTVDTQRGIAYVPTGSPTYDYYGADRIGANLFGSSIVALDARTGKRLWHFQMVHHDLWDFDNNAAPQLTTIRHNGRSRDVVAVAGKTGWLYVFDRVTGEPIWPIEERPVPKSDMPGEQTWPTQPFPTNPPPFAKQELTVDDVNPYLPPAEYERLKQRVLAANNKGLFTPINFTETVHMPGANGGALFGGTAAEPGTGAVYVITQDNPGMLRLLRPGETAGGGGPPAMPGQADLRAALSGVPRRGSARDGRGYPADSCGCRSSQQHRRRRAALRRGRDQGSLTDREEPHARLPATQRQRCRHLRSVSDGGAGRTRARRRFRRPWRRPRAAQARHRSSSPDRDRRGRDPATRAAADAARFRRIPRACPKPSGYVINTYGTIGNGMKPPFTTIVKYDLNVPAIKWRIGFGDDPALVERGVTARASRKCATASSSPNRVSCSVRGATTRFARGTATRASSSGRRGLAATSLAHPRCTRWMDGSICWFLPQARQAVEAAAQVYRRHRAGARRPIPPRPGRWAGSPMRYR